MYVYLSRYDRLHFRKKLIFRYPMPYKLAEAKYPGTVDEKFSSEIGTYVWMLDRCPDVRIPHLYGLGFSDHRHVSHLYRLMASVLTMLLAYSLYISNKGLSTSAFGVCSNPSPQPSSMPYPLVLYRTSNEPTASYHIYPNTGQMISSTWEKHWNDLIRRQKLFRGIARLILFLGLSPSVYQGQKNSEESLDL